MGWRLLIGGLAWLAFTGYVFTLGRRAARAGETGDIELADRSALDPTTSS